MYRANTWHWENWIFLRARGMQPVVVDWLSSHACAWPHCLLSPCGTTTERGPSNPRRTTSWSCVSLQSVYGSCLAHFCTHRYRPRMVLISNTTIVIKEGLGSSTVLSGPCCSCIVVVVTVQTRAFAYERMV